ncbi:MAG: cytochrome c biogenesis protein [Phycisphaerales bacterium JB065]
MNTRLLHVFLGAVIAAAFSLLIVSMVTRPPVLEPGSYGAEVELEPLDRMAVYHNGRLKSFESFSHEILGAVSGRKKYKGLPRDLLYLDLMFRPDAYADADLVFVKNESMRAQIVEALSRPTGFSAPLEDGFVRRLREFQESGLLSPRLLNDPRLESLKAQWRSDLIKTAKFVDQIESAIGLLDQNSLAAMLCVVPPATGEANAPWLSVQDLHIQLLTPEQARPEARRMFEAMPAQLRDDLLEQWGTLVQGWLEQDASRANGAIVGFASLLPRISPDLYPDQTRMKWEGLYFQLKNLTWVWLVYLLACIFLLMATVFRWDGARGVGIGMFGVAFLLHSASIGLRWWVAGRWPNSNMFEAVTTAFWFGAACAVVLEVWCRKTPFRNMFLLSGSVGSMIAMMSANFSSKLDASINNMMPVLHDLWLYIHTNVIIASYALIFMAAVTSLLYLGWRLVGGNPDYARVGGTEMLMETASDDDTPAAKRRRTATLGEVFDGATLVLIEFSFILLWAGIVMGAIWADHSWGRPWGWDPKEVFALNTFLVFVILLHVRLTAKDKGLWTALLALVGAGVMAFNWIVINFVISGLHSYA